MIFTDHKHRRYFNFYALFVCSLLAFVGLFWLVYILWDILVQGIAHLNLNLFVNDPAPPGMEGGGLRNAIVGHLLITTGATILGVPIGVLGGMFLAEYGRFTRFGRFMSACADVLLSAPTIVIGIAVYIVLVKPFSQFNGWSASVALGIILIPVVLRTTEEMMSMVPWRLREAALALGAPYHHVIKKISLSGAKTGIIAGVMFSIARIIGETAPLLFTAFNSSVFTTDMSGAMPTITVNIFKYSLGPSDERHAIAWAASFVLVLLILVLTISSRVLLHYGMKKRGFEKRNYLKD